MTSLAPGGFGRRGDGDRIPTRQLVRMDVELARAGQGGGGGGPWGVQKGGVKKLKLPKVYQQYVRVYVCVLN